MKRLAALLSFLVLPFADASETAPIGYDTAVQQLRSAVGLWDVETTQFADDGAVARVACGTYRFEWVVPDRVLAGRSAARFPVRRPGRSTAGNRGRARSSTG